MKPVQLMPVVKSGYLTASFQVPPGTNDEMFDKDPECASMEAALRHIACARANGIDTLELAAAHSRRTANVDPSMLADPVAHHFNAETNLTGNGGRDLSSESIRKLKDACGNDVSLGTFGVFENLLNITLAHRHQNIQHVRRVIRGAEMAREAGLGTEGVTIFIGRDVGKSVAENMALFVKVVIPIMLYAKERGVKIFIENCPMCGWSTTHEVFIQNIANSVEHWIMIARTVEVAGLKGFVSLNYDPSHDILQGTRPEWSFQLLARAGYGWFIGRFHGKDLSKQTGMLGMSTTLGSRFGNPWNKMNGDQPLPGATQHNPLAMANGLQVDWLGMMISARLHLQMNFSNTVFTTECEHGFVRTRENFQKPQGGWDQERHWQETAKLVNSSIGYIQGIDLGAAYHVKMHAQLTNLNAPWSYQPLNPNNIALFGIGAGGVIERALEWEMPPVPTTSDIVVS